MEILKKNYKNNKINKNIHVKVFFKYNLDKYG